jgi:hypothetical protein
VQGSLAVFEAKYHTDTKRVSEIPRLDALCSKLLKDCKITANAGHDNKQELEMISMQFKTLTDAFHGKVAMIQDKHDQLDKYAHRKVDYYDVITRQCDMVRTDMQATIEKMIF